MTRTIALLGIAAALILGVAYVASAQQMDGRNCEWAYKKLQQHRVYGTCNEQTSNQGLDGATDEGRTARREKATNK